MKRDRRTFWQDVAFGATIAAAIFLLFLATQVQAQEVPPPPLPLRIEQCAFPRCAMVELEQAAALSVAYADAVKRMADLERQLRQLKESKGCAKLEVTEPPRNFVQKKERDS